MRSDEDLNPFKRLGYILLIAIGGGIYFVYGLGTLVFRKLLGKKDS